MWTFNPTGPAPGGNFQNNGQSSKQVISSMENDRVRFEVIQYDQLSGGPHLSIAEHLYYAHRLGARLKQVRIVLKNGAVQIEAGALQFLRGNIQMESKIGGVGGFLKKMVSSKVTGEEMFKPTYQGNGELYLEPSFGNYLLVDLQNEEMVCDDGMFFACDTGIQVGAYRNKGLAAVLGGEGMFQTRLAGYGICVLESPVPMEEIQVVYLQNDTLQVDGNFALLRKGNIEFTVERSSKSLVGSITGGEGLLQTFRGTGEVWLAPTEPVYQAIQYKINSNLSKAFGNSE
jgi:uncharacterized protein (AIM24 family)